MQVGTKVCEDMYETHEVCTSEEVPTNTTVCKLVPRQVTTTLALARCFSRTSFSKKFPLVVVVVRCPRCVRLSRSQPAAIGRHRSARPAR